MNFEIDKSKYATNAPHLIVVAPKVFVPKQVKVDLTSRQIPEEVEGKAANGVEEHERHFRWRRRWCWSEW